MKSARPDKPLRAISASGFFVAWGLARGRHLAGRAGLVWLVATRFSRPIVKLTGALKSLAEGNFKVRVPNDRTDEIGLATEAFNRTAAELEQNRDRLVYLTQLASWQVLARKMAHEVKNSLTPIRLTVEEMVARHDEPSPEGRRAFLGQAAAIVVDEIESLERRIRAFSEFSSEPPVCPEPLDIQALVEERIAFLRTAHPEVRYAVEAAGQTPQRAGGSGSGKSILVNLLENAAEAAGEGGQILARVAPIERPGRHRSARFRPRAQRTRPQIALPAHHFFQEARHGSGAFHRAQERAAFGRRHPADCRRTGRRRFPRAAPHRLSNNNDHHAGFWSLTTKRISGALCA